MTVFSLRDTILRLLPHPTGHGLRKIGNPDPDAPVLVTGNYALTVRRLERALRGRDVWLLVANSRGVNVWCAAGGGHFTDHDVIAAIRASGLADKVSHRRLVLPQLAATGIEPRHIDDATGFKSRWGPARLEDLPAFLDRGGRVTKAERIMRFPAWERAEMAAMWAVPIAAVAALVLGLFVDGLTAAVGAGCVIVEIFGIFLAIPRVPIVGPGGWFTLGASALLSTAAGALVLALFGGHAAGALWGLALANLSAAALLAVDIAGTTPLHPGTINSLGNRYRVELVEERCTGAAACVQVCPRGVLAMDGARRKVRLAHPDDCILCGACIVQCPDDALRFRFPDGRCVEADVIRTTRLNMLGRRAAPQRDGRAC